MNKPAFLLNETSDFERLANGRVRFTVMCLPARGDARLGLFELTVEASEFGLLFADAMHGFDDDESPVDLTIGEATALEDWAMFAGDVRKAASDYFDRLAEQRAESSAEDAAYASL